MSGQSSLGEAVLDLTADDSKMTKDIEQAKGKVLNSLNGIAADMKRIGQTMTLALSLPLLALGTFSIDAASDLEETKNKTQVVFGEMGDAIIQWSADSATALGQSQEQALAAAATYGNLFITMGLGEEQAADLSTNLVELASDMASFNNASPEEVLAALQSGLIGQAEPLRKYGVLLTEDAVAAKALEMGLVSITQNAIDIREAQLKATDAQEAYGKALDIYGDDSEEAAKAGLAHAKAQEALKEAMAGNVGELSEAAKTQARYALILEQTATAQGDFARTSDGLANQTRIMKAQLTDAAAVLGMQLLPYALKLVEFLSMLMTKFQALTPEQKKWVVIIGVIVAAIGPLLMIVGSLISAFTAIAGVIAAISTPVLIVIGVIAALIAIGYLLYLAWKNNLGGIQERLNQFGDVWRNNVLPVIQGVWAWMNSTLFPFFRALGNFIGSVFNLALRALAGIWQNVLRPALAAVFGVLSAQLMPIFTKLTTFFNTTLLPIIKTVAKWIGENLVKAFNSLSGIIKAVTDTLNTLATGLDTMELPDWMTPGSPTPWEIGLRGVADALKTVNTLSLPTLTSNLNMMPAPATAGGSTGDITLWNPTFEVSDRRSFDELMRTMRK